MRRGLCTMCDQSPSDLCLGDSVARDRHVVIGWTQAWSAGPVQSCLSSLSHSHVTRDFSGAPCQSLQWAIYVNSCSADQPRDPNAAMPIGICESWLLLKINLIPIAPIPLPRIALIPHFTNCPELPRFQVSWNRLHRFLLPWNALNLIA